MNPWFKEGHEIFRRTVRRFMETELAPQAEEWEEKKDFPNWVFKRAGELGFLGITYPEEFGGSACDYFYKVVFCEELPRSGCGGVNMALLVPHSMLRISALGMEDKPADPEAAAFMKRLLEESMEAGAFGLSTGLQYFPGLFSDTDELVKLSEPLARYDGIFTSHLRSYTSSTLGKAIDEIGEVARANSIKGQVSHIFSLPWAGPLHSGQVVWTKSGTLANGERPSSPGSHSSMCGRSTGRSPSGTGILPHLSQ